MFLTSNVLSVIPGIIHGFGTASEPVPAPFLPIWQATQPGKQQVHGIEIAEVTYPLQDCGRVDGLVTGVAGIPISVVTADCVPVLLARKSGGLVAAIHAGWRGTKGGILRALWSRLRAKGENPKNWVAAIGPAIGPCCYEVSAELAEDFVRCFPSISSERILARPRMLDLAAINQSELQSIGLSEIDVIRSCTRCSVEADGTPTFRSFRREKAAGVQSSARQWSIVMIADRWPLKI
jgi:YfiH family protein